MTNDSVFGPLPKRKPAVFHAYGLDLYDSLAMDLYAMKYAEQCVKAEREACAKVCESLRGASSRRHAEAIRARGEE